MRQDGQTLDHATGRVPSGSRGRVHRYHRRHAIGLTARLFDALQTDDAVLRGATHYFLAAEGKYFRPLVTLLCCEVAGGDPDDAVDLACAVELVHASSLIFDDLPCMDGATMRRGQPCLHMHCGEAVAILTALHFLTTGITLAAAAGHRPATAVGMLTHAIGAEGLVVGQIRDLAGQGHLDSVRERKTRPLLRAAAQFGALAARADRRQEDAVIRYADRLGLAFQLRDDVLDREAAPDTQRRASALTAEAADAISEVFGETPAALSLAALADYAVERAH